MGPDAAVLKRILDKVDIPEDEEMCWIWNGQLRNGYPSIKIRSKCTTVARTLWMIRHNAHPKRVRMSCKNKLCVNPDHVITEKCLTWNEYFSQLHEQEKEKLNKLKARASDRVLAFSPEKIRQIMVDSNGRIDDVLVCKKHCIERHELAYLRYMKKPWEQKK